MAEFGRNFSTVWRLLSRPQEEKWALSEMLHSADSTIADQANAFYKVSRANTEMAGIRNHLRTNLTKTCGEPAIMATLNDTNIDFRSMSKVPQSVYICMPGDMVETHFRYMKLINLIALTEIETGGLVKHDAKEEPTYFFLDEFASQKKAQAIIEAMGRMREWGCRFHLVTQSAAQLSAIYGPEFQAILGNVGCLNFLGGTNSTLDGELISKMCGVKTEPKEGNSQGSKPGDHGTVSNSWTARPCYTPDEVMRLKMPKQIIKLAGQDATEGWVIDPSLNDFPQYRVFQDWIEAGYSPEQAEKASEPYATTGVPPPPKPLKWGEKTLRSIANLRMPKIPNPFRMIGILVAFFFGDDTSAQNYRRR